MNRFEQFVELHNQNSPLLLGNVWDAGSALTFQNLGFKAIGTSSAAIASSLGFEDGENISFDDLINIVKNIQSKIKIPLTVDIEGGYSRNIDEVCKNIKSLADLRVAGINIEDSIVNQKREILDVDEFCDILRSIKKYLAVNNIDMFLNARTDSYIMGLENPLEKTLKRAKLYEEVGADGIFVPCITKEQDIKQIVDAVSLPINVMTMPVLPAFDTLTKLGVMRISMGPFVYNNVMQVLENTLNTITKNQSSGFLF